MNILLIHNTYQQAGGEDVVVEQERRLLERNGHKISIYQRSNHEINSLSFGQRLGLIGRVVSASDSSKAVRGILQTLKPDLVHVHNTFMMVSPSVYEACQQEGVPVVQTLHNYRLLCPAATFYRNGKICQDCVTDTLLSSVKHGCYRDSRAMTGAIALMLKTHRLRKTWNQGIDAYIAISSFVKEQFTQAGFPSEKIHVKPNFVAHDPGERKQTGKYALFVGRLTSEKGIETVVEAWKRLPGDVPLVVVGDGPLRTQMQAATKNLANVGFTGWLKREEVQSMMKEAAFVIAASTWYEPFGLILAESFACGTPVLGARIGAIESMLHDGVTGLHFTPGDAQGLADKATWAWEHPTELALMGKAARKTYEDHYTSEINYKLLMNIYASAIEAHGKTNYLARHAA
jgi:glycosyltransferase involved in cell wall biosynthesis